MAQVASKRLDQIQDPELSIEQAKQDYKRLGYSDNWINQRLKTIEIRKQLTDEWQRVGIKNQEDFAILTSEITKAWSGRTVKEYKILKNLKKENLRDNMTNLELVLNMLAEATTKEISEKESPSDFETSKEIAKEGGKTAGVARKRIEKRLGKPVVSSKNAKDIHFKDNKRLE